ncbi:MAG: helix-turn-helix domain-containing protein [Mycobacterium sp.]|uniref:helix-turn-helix domain-containing protein n=1 Tax=Mycobacterium sp. TaxID=1785 RepID=UPI003C32292A
MLTMRPQLRSRIPPTSALAIKKCESRLTSWVRFHCSDLAQAAGVGVRQLQKLFRDEFDMSPAHYLRNVRLDGARSDLISGDEVTIVSDVAHRWGFNHLGRFAAHYEHKFGETPSRTLRQRRKVRRAGRCRRATGDRLGARAENPPARASQVPCSSA